MLACAVALPIDLFLLSSAELALASGRGNIFLGAVHDSSEGWKWMDGTDSTLIQGNWKTHPIWMGNQPNSVTAYLAMKGDHKMVATSTGTTEKAMCKKVMVRLRPKIPPAPEDDGEAHKRQMSEVDERN